MKIPKSFPLRLLLFALAYGASAELSYLLLFDPGNFATFWPPVGIYMALLVSTPPRRWWAVALAASVPNLFSDVVVHQQPLGLSLGFLVVNLGAPLVGAALITWLCRPALSFERLQHVWRWSLIVIFVSAPLGALGGGALMTAAHGGAFGRDWFMWWLGDLLGVLVAMPLTYGLLSMLSWRAWPPRAPVIEAIVLLMSLSGATWFLFHLPNTFALPPAVLFLFLMWAALRFGATAVAAAAAVLTVFTIQLTETGLGPYGTEMAPSVRLLMAQMLVVTGILLFYTLAAVVAERRAAVISLEQSNVRLEQQVQARTAKLSDAKELLQLGIKVAEFAICEIDYTNNTNHLSKEAAKLYGLGDEEMTVPREAVHATFHPNEATELAALINESLNPDGDGWFAHEHRVVHQNGEVRWFNVRKQIFFDRTQNPPRPSHGILVAQDITERKEIEEAVGKSDERVRRILNQSPVGIVETDAAGRMVLVNPRWCEMLGYSEAELLKMSVIDITHESSRAATLEAVGNLAKGGADFQIEKNYQRKDGSIIRASSNVSALRGAYGEFQGLVGVILDITERIQRERNLAFLAALSKDFAPLSSTDEIMEIAGARIAECLNLSHCLFVEINEAKDEATVLHDHHAADAPSLVGVYRLADFHTEAERAQLATGNAIIISDVRDELRLPEAAAKFEALGIRALTNMPYLSGGQWKFTLSAQHSQPHQWRTDENELLSDLASRIWTRLERARVEAHLRESEERFRTLFDSIDEGFCIIEMIFDETNKPVDYRFVQANPAMERLTGLKDAIGKTISEMVPDLEKHWFEFYGNVALTGEAARIEGEAAAMNRWFEIYASRVGHSTNRVAVIFNNITERKENEARLHASEVRYRRLFETAKDGILILDSTTAKITNANPYIGELLGFSHAELIGKELWEIGLFKDIEESKAAVRELQAKKYIRYEDLPLETKAGRRADVEFVSNVYRENGHSVIQCNIRDITERKYAEAERERLLAEAQRLREVAETATRAKDEFLAVVSHELRNPLNSMLGYARLMRANPHDATQVAHYAEVVERNARMQQQLIEDLLDTARIISGKLKIETAPTDLRLVLADALAVVRPAAEAKQIELRAALGDEPQPLIGDAARLQQVAWNLLQNAIKFTPAQGRVEVRLEKSNDEHLCLIVSDTGKGIEPEFQSTIFDRFTQQDMSSTRRHGGLGLGLTLAKQLVELHGGTIAVTSPGRDQGSTFTVRLPQRANLPTASAHTLSALSISDTAAMNSVNGRVRLDGLRLLVVDDQEEALQLLGHTLREGGALVTLAESGVATLALFEEQLFDLLVCDIAMPEMDGYELLRRLREQTLSQRLPAIALTAHARPQDRLRALAAGFQMHVAKPVESEELITVIASLTGRL